MNDEQAIRALQLAYAEHFDNRNADGFAALFTPTALITQHDGRSFSGTEKLRKAVLNMPPPNGGFHRMESTRTIVDGDTAQAYCQFLARTADGRHAQGHYDDTYLRTPDGWRISARKVTIDRWVEDLT